MLVYGDDDEHDDESFLIRRNVDIFLPIRNLDTNYN